jgi:hypothetical protein
MPWKLGLEIKLHWVAPTQYFTDDVSGDTVWPPMQTAQSTLVQPYEWVSLVLVLCSISLEHLRPLPNPLRLKSTSNQIQLGTGNTMTISASTPGQSNTITLPDPGTATSQIILQDSGSGQTINSAMTFNGNTTFNGQPLINLPSVGGLGSMSLTGTGSVALSLRSFLLTTASTFLSDSAVPDIILRNGVGNAALRIGFGTGSPSSVVINSSRSTFNTPVTVQCY